MKLFFLLITINYHKYPHSNHINDHLISLNDDINTLKVII